MSSLDKKFKDNVNKEFKELDYIGKKVFLRAFLVIALIAVVSAVGNVAYKEWKTDKDREVFKNSVTYNESAASFLADRYDEYNKAETKEEKNSIMQYVVMRYPNLDTDGIENDTLRQFYNKCVIGG